MIKIKFPKATHEGELDINGQKLRCYNLSTGERVFSRESLLKAIGRTGKPKHKESEGEVFQLPTFLRAKNLKPFISNELMESSQPIIFEMKGGRKAYGYLASVLPSICYVFTDAKRAEAGAVVKTSEAIVAYIAIINTEKHIIIGWLDRVAYWPPIHGGIISKALFWVFPTETRVVRTRNVIGEVVSAPLNIKRETHGK